MRAVLVSAVTLSFVAAMVLHNGCKTGFPGDAEDKDVYMALPVTGTCTQELSSAEAERTLGLTGPVTVSEFAIGVEDKALYSVLVDSQRRTLAVWLSQSDYTANLIQYNVSLTSNGNALAFFTWDAGDVRFKAFEVLCVHWVNRSFATSDLNRIARAELNERAVTANEIMAYFEYGSANQQVVLTPSAAAKILGVALPVEVTALAFCGCDAPMYCGLTDATGLIHRYEFEHATGTLKTQEASVREPERKEALRVLLCDWCERAFPRASRLTTRVRRPRSEEIANRVLAFFRPQYIAPDVRPELQRFTGKVCTYYANGRTKSQTPYVNGRENGIGTLWHENGQKKEEWTIVEGMVDGKLTSWYENGNKAKESEWRNKYWAG